VAKVARWPSTRPASRSDSPVLERRDRDTVARGYGRWKGTIRFTVDRPVPAEVLTEIVRLQMDEIDGR
jgi:uncharacterized protein YdhG (YjbR/CyaY superfamily)